MSMCPFEPRVQNKGNDDLDQLLVCQLSHRIVFRRLTSTSRRRIEKKSAPSHAAKRAFSLVMQRFDQSLFRQVLSLCPEPWPELLPLG